MKALEVINQIKNILGIELSEVDVQLAEMKLENGTKIEAEEFKKDKEVFIVSEDGEKLALPVGTYSLESGQILKVEEEGLIAEIHDDEKEMKDHEDDEKKMKDHEEEMTEVEQTKVKSKTETTQVVYATKEELSALVSKIDELKSLLEKEPKVEEVEMSAEVVEPIAHNPEAIGKTKVDSNQYTNAHLRRIREMIYNK